MNNQYKNEFLIAINEREKYFPTEQLPNIQFSFDNTFNKYINLEKINNYNQIILQRIGNSSHKGLCSILSNCTYEFYPLLTNSQISYLTIGQLKYNNTIMFNTPSKKDFLKSMFENLNINNNIMLGSNSHVWITLDNGYIIDPSIQLSLHDKNEVLIDTPKNLYKNHQLEYKPYYISQYTNINKINEIKILHNINESNLYNELVIKNLNDMVRNDVKGFY